MDQAVREKILGHLQSKGLRITSQRRAIIEAAFSTKEHFSAEALLDAAKKIDSTVSRATIYRTLPLLVETGLLHELELGKGFKHYDPNYATNPIHNHLICLDCDQIFEFEDERLESLGNTMTKKLGFQPKNKHLRIEARCQAKQSLGSCPRASEKLLHPH